MNPYSDPEDAGRLAAPALPLTRRRFVQGMALGGLALALGWPRRGEAVPELNGSVLDLRIGEQRVNFTGATRTAITVNGSLPAPVLRVKEGELLTVNVTNALAEDTSIHWHGILLPANMDGVPEIGRAHV